MITLKVDGLGGVRDDKNRRITLRGINLDGSSKLPKRPEYNTFKPVQEDFWDGDNVSFVGRPFELEEAPQHLERIRSWGFNTIRYVYTWEALEHGGPGKYDDEFIDYTIKVLKLLDEYGFYVTMDPHQDIWGRYSGGSGAPLWTYYAAGLDPKGFHATEAALVQNMWDDPDEYPKMYWATNYARLVCGVMFTMFFAGREYMPKAIIDGVNIQDYLQQHMLDAMLYFYGRIRKETDLFNRCIIGVETMNEPNSGYIGLRDITEIPEEQQPKIGNIPTPLQTMILGMGKPATVQTYIFGRFGPRRSSKQLVDPQGVTAWMQDDSMDKKYGWSRDPQWKLGTCIFALHGVWDPETEKALKPNYFCSCPESGHDVDEPYFVNNHFRRYWERFYTAMRKMDSDLFLLCGPPVMAIPPTLKGTEFIDDRVMYCPHFYDGITIMLKRWNKYWNLDCLGYLRDKYSSPLFAIRIGEQNVRNCLRDEVIAMRDEGIEHMGTIPCYMSETGMPFDMNDKEAYYKTGDYTNQIEALDTIGYALEGARINHAYWCYTSTNTHAQGDGWNGEDFSFWSNDVFEPNDSTSINRKSRAQAAYMRPFPAAVLGSVTETSFDLKNRTYHLEIEGEKSVDGPGAPAIIFVPDNHYPEDRFDIKVSTGDYKFDPLRRVLLWYHEPGTQTLDITPVDDEGDQNYGEDSTCACNVM